MSDAELVGALAEQLKALDDAIHRARLELHHEDAWVRVDAAAALASTINVWQQTETALSQCRDRLRIRERA